MSLYHLVQNRIVGFESQPKQIVRLILAKGPSEVMADGHMTRRSDDS